MREGARHSVIFQNIENRDVAGASGLKARGLVYRSSSIVCPLYRRLCRRRIRVPISCLQGCIKMIRFFGKSVLTFSALALLASPALAQGRGAVGGSAAGFLMAPNVQRDLKLTDTQVKKVQETLREIKERHQEAYAALHDASYDVRWTKMAALNAMVCVEVKNALELSAEQSRRFDQISLQAHGLLAFASRAVDDKLKLSDDQKSKIREIAEATHNSFAGADNNNASEQEARTLGARERCAQREHDQGLRPAQRRPEGVVEGTDRRADPYRIPGAAVDQLIVRPAKRSESPDPLGMASSHPRGFFGEDTVPHQRVTAGERPGQDR